MLLQFGCQTKTFPCVERFLKSSVFNNLKNHINKMHPELIPPQLSIQQEVANKQAKDNVTVSMSVVKIMKPQLYQHKVAITRWLYLNGIPFNVTTSPEFWAIYEKHYDNYTVLSLITFNNNVYHDYQCFVIECVDKLTHGIQQHHDEPFLHVMHNMVTLNDRNNYFGAPVSLMSPCYA